MDYWLVDTGNKKEPGINGGILKRVVPVNNQNSIIAFVCTIDVANIDAHMQKILANNGKIIIPKNEIPGVGLFAQCNDTEGNLFGIMQSTMKTPME